MKKNPVRILKRFTHSLSFKLSFYAGFIMLIALLAFTYHSVKSQERSLKQKTISGALKDSEVVKAALWHGMMTNDREVIREIVEALGKRGGFEEVGIFDRNGILRFSSDPEAKKNVVGESSDPFLKSVRDLKTIRHRISPDGEWITVVNPVFNAPSCSTAACHAHPESHKVLGALSVRKSLGDARGAVYTNARRTVIFAFLLFLGISSIIGLAVIFLVNPNIEKLRKDAMDLARGTYEPHDPSSGSDEIAELSRSFYEMSLRVNERTTELAEGRRIYKSLFEEVPCYLTVVDRNYRIVRANKAFRDQFGNHVGKNCFVGYKGLNHKCDDCPVEKTFADGSDHQSDEVWRLNGSEAYVMVRTAPIFDDDGNISEVLEMSVDVTRLKRLQLELARKHEQYKTLFDNVPCYLTVVDRNFLIVESNEQFRREFGEPLGRRCYRVYKGKEQKCDNCPVERTFADGLSHRSEEVWHRNGEEQQILVHTAPLRDASGEITGVMEMSLNITEVKRLQAELALLGETIAGMSHTIKNIVNGLQGGVYIVDSGLERGREDRVKTGWDMVKKNVEKISDLVKGILYASKHREPDYQDCDPATLLTEVCDLYDKKAQTDGIRLVRDFPPAMGSARLDPAGIHSVVSNLVSNALEARDSDDSKKHTVTVGAYTEPGRVIITVSDNGVGIPDNIKQRLFSKFYSTKGSGGTGLGLVITKKVVEEHGGTISVESQPGSGTTFSIELPADTIERREQVRGTA